MATHSPMSQHHDHNHDTHSKKSSMEHTKDIDIIDKDKGHQSDGRDSVRSVQEPASTTDEHGQQHKHVKSVHHPLPFHTSPHHGYPGFGSPTYIIDPANGLAIDPRYVPGTFHPPIPVDARTHEGRYHYEPHMHHPAMHGHSPVSPVLSDISVIPLAPQRISPGYPYYPYPYAEQFHGSPALSVLSHARGLSPGTDGYLGHPPYLHHITPPGFHPHPGITEMMSGAAHMGSEHPAVDMATIEGTRSPTALARRLSRKRALSISPLSETLDINSMIRTSPNSLVAYINNSRNSSAASGSYGHLSAGAASSPTFGWHPSVTPIAHLQQLQQHMLKRGSPFLSPGPDQQSPHHLHASPAMQTLLARAHHHHGDIKPPMMPPAVEGPKMPGHHPDSTRVWAPYAQHPIETNNNQVTSTVEIERKQREAFKNSNNVTSTSNMDSRRGVMQPGAGNQGIVKMKEEEGEGGKTMPEEEELPVVTDCEWTDCNNKYDTLEQLVHHINNDHIHNERKEFICRWVDCIREEKPFKAQYMLVVHMRRHTGEKPHRCTFEACFKAYSRLENLKTHLRSHTGERPYVCEFQGCTKAFSNASDRAKHQNRTHSNAKPYACKIPGCTKRYTDPSSLRKHVKTVHGPDAHVTKKQRGDKRDPPNSGTGSGKGGSNPSNGDSGMGVGSPNNNNNIIKKEIEPIVPFDQKIVNQLSPEAPKIEPTATGNSCIVQENPIVEYSSSPHNDSGVEMNITGGGSLSDLTALDDDKIQDNHVSSNMGPSDSHRRGRRGAVMAVTTQSHVAQVGNPMTVKSGRRGVRSGTPGNNRLSQKVKNAPALPQLPPIVMRRPASRGDSRDSMHPDDPRCDSSLSFGHSQPPLSGMNQLANRRGSNNSTISSYYSSHRSSEASPYPFSQLSSRRSSDASSLLSSRRTSGSMSQFSTHKGMMSSPYDPISPGSSRRSSDASSMNGQTGLPGLTIEDQCRLRAKYDEVTGKRHAWELEVPSSEASSEGEGPSPMPPPLPSPRDQSRAHKFKVPTSRTPLPNEVPGVENRRASDPMRSNGNQGNQQFNLPRQHSQGQINRTSPLPVPDNMSSLKQGYNKPMTQSGQRQNFSNGPPNGNHSNNRWVQGPPHQQQMVRNNMMNRTGMMSPGNNMANRGMMSNMHNNMQMMNGMGGGSKTSMHENNMGPFSPPQHQQLSQQQQQYHRQQQQHHMMQQQYLHQQQGMPQQQGQYMSSGMMSNNSTPTMQNMDGFNRLNTRRGAIVPDNFMGTPQQQYMNGNQQQYYNHGSPGQISNGQGGNMMQITSHPSSMEMSPGCNQVSSTVMDGPKNSDHANMECDDPMASGLAALSTDGLDHVQQLIPDTVSPSILMPPPPLPHGMSSMSNHSNMMPPPVTPISNMVVSDMSSMLSSLAEENRFLNMMA